MKALLIFDCEIDLDKINYFNTRQEIDVFPLTSNFTILNQIEKDININKINSAFLINQEVQHLQKKIHAWSHDFGNFRIHQKKIKEWLILPDKSGSSWWFSLLSEKNTVQDDVFFKIAQVNSIVHYVNNHSYDVCILYLQNKTQSTVLRNTLKTSIKNIICINPLSTKTKKEKLFNYLKKPSLLAAILSSLLYWFIWARDHRQAKKMLPPLKERLQKINPFLFITYFPNIDDHAAEQGTFKNKYALPLQDKLKQKNIRHSWLAMPVYYNGHNFQSALRLAKKFIQHNESLLLLQEFFSKKILLQGLYWWLRQTLVGSYLFWHFNRKENKTLLCQDIIHPQAFSYLKYLWWHSIAGTSATRGIIFYLTYREVFRKMPNIRHCLYYCEMQAWEKAMLTAQKNVCPQVKTLAFQHTIVPKNFFHYFYHPNELLAEKKITDFPLPQQLIANGEVTFSLLKESNYPNLTRAEAIRQLYIQNFNQLEPVKRMHKEILFVGGSYDKIETKSLISLLHQILPKLSNYTIWLKGSPINPLEPIFKELNIDWQQSGYHIQYKDLKELLPYAKIALVANTTVALEALALGCALIIPFFADTMLMNPVIDTQAKYQLVSTPTELLAAINNISDDFEKNKNIINHYWTLDPKIPNWDNILNQCV